LISTRRFDSSGMAGMKSRTSFSTSSASAVGKFAGALKSGDPLELRLMDIYVFLLACHQSSCIRATAGAVAVFLTAAIGFTLDLFWSDTLSDDLLGHVGRPSISPVTST
jgi:hypothetical protein